jgi:hypothetical protein
MEKYDTPSLPGSCFKQERFRAGTSMGAKAWSGFGCGGKHRGSGRKHRIYTLRCAVRQGSALRSDERAKDARP